jgi:hypothetical protein
MKARDLDTKEATCKWAAFSDARQRNLNNASHFTEASKVRAERMKLALELVYRAKDIYINYRKTKIAIKLNAARVADRRNLALLEADWEKQGVVKTASAQGVIYSFA